MQYRLSSLLLLVAVIALLCITFIQWRQMDILATRLEMEQLKTETLKEALMIANEEFIELHTRTAQSATQPTSPAN